jgi:hypothetical protein
VLHDSQPLPVCSSKLLAWISNSDSSLEFFRTRVICDSVRNRNGLQRSRFFSRADFLQIDFDALEFDLLLPGIKYFGRRCWSVQSYKNERERLIEIKFTT